MDNSVEQNEKFQELREKVYQAKQKGYSGLLLNLDDVILLFEEYDDERAAHNSHVTELCDAEAKASRLQVERDQYRKEAGEERLQTEHIVAEREELIIENERLRVERDKAVEGLRWYAEKSDAYVTSYGCDPCGISKRAKSILSGLGVPHENT
jgi:hypothetical protein